MQANDGMALNSELRHFKTKEGLIKFESVLSIPVSQRIPELAKINYLEVCKVVLGALTVAMESMNLKRGLNASQLNDLADAVVDTANEDNLSLQDLMLFLQKLTRGEYGVTYESMDIPKFMQFFEKYREERWQELNRIRIEGHIQNKVQGDTGRTAQPDELSEHFSSMGSRLAEMKDNIKVLREQNKNLKIDNF